MEMEGMKTDYRKHIYWLTREEESRLREDMEARGTKIASAKGVSCSPLRTAIPIASAAPEVWDSTCARQGSWYRASSKNGLYLIVASFEIESHAHREAAVITQSGFTPPRTATIEEKKRMAAEPGFARRIPPAWEDIGKREKKVYLRWARKLGSTTDDFDFLYCSHTANHANFMDPRFFIEENGAAVPYSIDRSAHLCSCCLELFQVIGEQHGKKLVAPCPGAVAFAKLPSDQYLLVEKR